MGIIWDENSTIYDLIQMTPQGRETWRMVLTSALPESLRLNQAKKIGILLFLSASCTVSVNIFMSNFSWLLLYLVIHKTDIKIPYSFELN